MLSVTEARLRILSHFQTAKEEALPLAKCAGRVLAQDIAAPYDLPLFNNSSMDGFAIRAADSAAAATDSPLTLRVIADIPAGSAPKVTLVTGEAARIMTGAQVPLGADAVIPVEDTDFQSRDPGTTAPQTISLTRIINPGENIRSRGMDLKSGDVVLKNGRMLRAQDLGLLAMLGLAKMNVYKKPRIALFSSGDELVDIEVPLTNGKIHDSNSYALAALIEGAGCQVIRLGVAKDSLRSVTTLLNKAIKQQVDLILSSAGVSVGAFDFVKDAIEADGSLDFWRVNMRPGKPLAFGQYQGCRFIGLPGNPVSAFAGFEVFVRPVLQKLSGQLHSSRLTVRVRCEEEIESDGRESYLRATVREENGVYSAKLTGHQGSGNLLSLVQADALLIIPAGVKCVPVGQEVDAIIL